MNMIEISKIYSKVFLKEGLGFMKQQLSDHFTYKKLIDMRFPQWLCQCSFRCMEL